MNEPRDRSGELICVFVIVAMMVFSIAAYCSPKPVRKPIDIKLPSARTVGEATGKASVETRMAGKAD